MEIFEFNELFFEIVLLYFLNILLILRLFAKLNFLAIVVWPIIIYSIGPYLTSVYLVHPVLSKYVFPENFLEESALYTVLLLVLLALDKIFCIGNIIRDYVMSPEMSRLGSSRRLLFFFYASGTVSAIFQIALMASYGSIFTGNYLAQIPTDQSGGQSISWGELAGLYEIFFSCTVALFVAKKESSLISRESLFYYFVIVLRLFGGTRFIVIKELSILLFILLCQKRVRLVSVSIFSILVVAGGTVVGIARSGGGEQEFGALSSFAYEASLSALTLNIADNLSHDESAYQFYHPVDNVIQLTASLVPTFIRNIFVPEKKKGVEINMATEAGFDTISPVGSMSLFASSIYIFYYAWVGPFIFPIILLLITKISFQKKIKSYVLVAIFIESLQMWRDPFEVSLKLIVQTIVFYWFVGMDWNALFRQMTRPKKAPPISISAVPS